MKENFGVDRQKKRKKTAINKRVLQNRAKE